MADHLHPDAADGAGHDAYVLRDQDRSEIARLRLQHEVWAGPTREALRRAAFPSGAAIADLGCGPGFLAIELAERVGPGGSSSTSILPSVSADPAIRCGRGSRPWTRTTPISCTPAC